MTTAIDLRYMRVGTSADLNAQNPILPLGYPALEVDTNRLKVGDGVTVYAALAFYNGNSPADALSAAEVDALSNTAAGQLGMLAVPVQQVVNASLGVQAQTFNQQLAQTNVTLGGPYVVDNQTFATVPLLAAYLAQKAGTGASPSVPTITGAPTINDSTVDVTQANVVVTNGTTTGGTITQILNRWQVQGVAQSSLWQPVGGFAQTVAAGGGVALATTQILNLEQLIYYVGSATPLSNKSQNYTLNAGAAVPVNTILPSVTGTAAPNAALGLQPGSWTTTLTTLDYNVYDGAKPALGGVLLTTQTLAAGAAATLTVPAAYAGKTLVLGVVAHNATGPSIEAYAVAVAVSGAQKPVQIAPFGFFVSGGTGTSPVGTALSLDYGLLPGTSLGDFWDIANNNAPSAVGFIVVMERDGTDFLQAANLTTYTPTSLDQDKTLSFRVTASNGAGASTPSIVFTNPSIQIVAQVGGGGGGGAVTTSFVGATSNGSNSVGSLGIAVGNISPAVQLNDALLHIRSNNGGVAWNGTPTGFSTQLDSTFTLTGNGKLADAYVKSVTGSEIASYVSTPTSPPEIIGMVLAAWRRSDGTAASWLAHAQITPNNSANATGTLVTWPTITSSSPAAGQRQVLVLVLDPSAGESTTFSNLPTDAAGQPFALVGKLDFTGSGINWQPIYIFEGAAPSSGATGTKAVNVNTSAGTFGFGGFTFIVG